MKRKSLLLALISLIFSLNTFAQEGVQFKYNNVEEAIKASSTDQHIFVDLFATWCGPCQMMDKQIFPIKAVGDYINANFVTCRIDADSEEGKAFMTKHKIDKLPTLAVLDGDGKLVKTHSGLLDDFALIRFCKEIKGDLVDMDALYKAHKKNKDDLTAMQNILLEAPYFIRTVTSETQMKKWGLRINDIFKMYVEKKGVENMANLTDFKIISVFHNFYEKDDNIIEKITRNYQDFAKAIDGTAVSQFVTGVHMNYIIGLAQTCDQSYERELNRLTGDLLHVYSAVQDDPEGFKSTLSEFCLATCALSKKDIPTYIQHMDNYFLLVPDVTYNDYAQAIEGVYNTMNEKIDNNAADAIIKWGTKAIEMNPSQVEASAPLYMVMGDAHKQKAEIGKAKEMYDKAFELMMKSQVPQFIESLQPQISRRLQELK